MAAKVNVGSIELGYVLYGLPHGPTCHGFIIANIVYQNSYKTADKIKNVASLAGLVQSENSTVRRSKNQVLPPIC